MATPKPGEIRCPTCHRSTPPAGFCTQCGSAIPSDARIRPRGLDRDELQERIRARRSGGEPYRRGGAAGAEVAGYERFTLQPEDEAARHASTDAPRPDLLGEAPRAAVERRDLTREEEEWAPPAASASDRDAVGPPAAAAAPYLASVEDYREPESAADTSGYESQDRGYTRDDYADGVDYADDGDYADWEDPRDRRPAGAGALAILGFLALGVLALLGGAVLAGVFSSDPPTGQADASATPVVSSTPVATSSATVTPEPSPSGNPAASDPGPSGGPIAFEDGFLAEVQPCLPGTAEADGCDSNGAVSGGALDIWVGFQNGNQRDVVSAEIVRPDGSRVSGGTIDLADIGCREICKGWTRFSIQSGLQPGTYDILVTRNGEPAGESSFVVS